MRNWIFTWIVVLFSFCGLKLFGQQHVPCGPNPVMFSNTCTDACLVCDLNGVMGRTTNTIPGQSPPGYCTMVVHSMQWLAFIPGTPNLSFNVSVSACVQNNGVEMGMYASSDCQTFKLVSNCNTNMYNNQTWSFTNTEPLKPGCIYYLVFDGNGANSCDVSFTVTAGSAAAPVPNTTNKISGKTLVCVGEVAEYIIPMIPGACQYDWRVEKGSILSQQDNKITVQWDQPGIGKVCVQGTNACKSGNEVCLEIEIGEESPLTELGPYYVCFGESYKYKNLLLTAGTWQFNDQNKYGCDSNVVVIVENLDLLETRLDTFLCFPDTLKIGTTKIDGPGNYRIPLKSKEPPFCDSTVLLKVRYAKLNATIHKSSDLSCQDTVVLLNIDTSGTGMVSSIHYVWKNAAGDTISLADSCAVRRAGSYSVYLRLDIDSIHFCDQLFTTEVYGSILPPDLFLKDTQQFCAGSLVNPRNLHIEDRNGSAAEWTFHFAFPCTPTNLIVDSLWLLERDTLVYLKATSAFCEDVLAVPIKILARQHIIIDPVEVCANSSILLVSLPFRRDGVFSGGPAFFNCYPPDSLCAVHLPVTIHRDTSFYILPQQATCPDTSRVLLMALRIPDADFVLDKTDYCFGDSILIQLQNRMQTEEVFWKLDSSGGIWKDTASMQKFVLRDTGLHQICIYKTENKCADTLCSFFKLHPLPISPTVQCESTDSSILFFWNRDQGQTYAIDTLKGGPIRQQTDTSIYFYPLARGQEIQLVVTAKSTYCGAASTSLSCQSKTCPPVILTVVPVDTLCIDPQTLPIKLTVVSTPARPAATVIWRGPGVIDTLSGIFDPQVAGPGNHRIFVVMRDNGCLYISETVLVVRNKPFADFTLDSVICQDSFLVVRFTGQREDSSLFEWNFGDGQADFVNGIKNVRVKWSKPGRKILRLKLSHLRCFHESVRDLEVLEPLKVPEVECEQLDSFIQFRWRQVKRVKKYKVQLISGNNGQFINDTTYQIKKRFFEDSARIQLILEDMGPCSDASGVEWSCNPPDCPPKSLLVDTTLVQCIHRSQRIGLRQLLQDSVEQMQWFGPAIQSDSIQPDQLESGSYLFVLRGERFGCKYVDSIRLQLESPPDWGSIRVEPIPCPPRDPFGSVILTNVSSSKPPVEYRFGLGGFGLDSASQLLTEGIYGISIRDRSGCVRDTVVSLVKPKDIAIELGPNIELLKGETAFLQAMITGNYEQIRWTSAVQLSCEPCENPIVTPGSDLKIYCTVVNQDGCIATDSLFIRVFENRVYAPNVFSPNGDQINDHFSLFGNLREVKQLEIFDRWGNRIFYKEHFDANQPALGWDGRFNEQACLPGVYVYRAVVAFEKGADQFLQGDITLIK